MEEVDSIESCTPRNVLRIFADAKLSCNLRVLGSQLGLSTAHLDEIETLPYHLRMIQTLDRVADIRGLSWSLLASILRKPALKEYAVAFAIERHSSMNRSTSSSHSESVTMLRSLSTSTGTSSPETSLTSNMDNQERLELTIQNVVNMIAEVSNWQELGIFLGLDPTDIDIIRNDYEPREYRQRLVEKWFSREPERSWEKLQRALDEVGARRGSQTSKYSILSTPTSPMDVETDGTSLSLHNLQSVPSSTIDTESQIEELERRFTNIQIDARKELEKREGTSAIELVELVKDQLTAMPLQKKDKTPIKAIVRRKKPFHNLTEFFLHLNTCCWNFLEYHALKQLIVHTCSEKLNEKVKAYVRDVQRFQRNTTITEFLKYRRHLAKKKPVLEKHKKLKMEHSIDPDLYTLAELEGLRMNTCIHVKLSDFALQMYSVESKCIVVEWIVPEEIVEILSLFYVSEIGQKLLQTYQVECISLDGKTLYSWVLLATIKSGDYEKATSILQEKYTDLDLNCQDYDNGRSVLFYAAAGGMLDLVQKLLEQGADLNITDMEGKSTLMIAVEGGHIEVVKLILRHDYQCDTNIQEKTLGWTALHYTAEKGREDIADLLINPVLQTDVLLVDNSGKTAIQIAQENKHDKVVELLSDFEPTSGETEPGGEVVGEVEAERKQVSARPSRGPRIKKFLLRIPWPQRKKRNKLIEAAKIGSEAEVRKLLDEGEDPNSHEDNKSKWTSLLYASHNGHHEIVKLLLEKDANPNWRSADEGYTALNLAGYKGFVEILELLLQYRAEVNATTEVTKQTALQRVCLYTPDRYKRAKEPPSERRCEVVQLLLMAGADIKILDEQNRTPLIAASRSGFPGIVKILLEKIKEFPDDERQKYLDHEMRHSWTALMEASEAGYNEIVRMLLDAGATLKQEKKDKVTALHIAVHHKHTAVVQELVKKPEKEVLNARDHYGMTPLILATKAKNEEMIKILLNAGADLDLQTEDADKMTALMYAVKHGARDLIKILVKHKANLLITDAKKRTARDMAKSSAIRRYLYEIEQEQQQLATAQKSQSLQVQAT